MNSKKYQLQIVQVLDFKILFKYNKKNLNFQLIVIVN